MIQRTVFAPLLSGLLAALPVAALDGQPSDPPGGTGLAFAGDGAGTLWVATEGGGVWRSFDGGGSWLIDDPDLATATVTAIGFAADTTGYAGTTAGSWRCC